jgi:hypothetical protein
MEANSSVGAGNAFTVAATGLDATFVLAASKMLQDQAALALSAFQEVPGAELWAVVETAVNATVVAGAFLRSGTVGTAGFGTVLYALLMPLLPAVEVLIDRAGSTACWMQQQVGSLTWARFVQARTCCTMQLQTIVDTESASNHTTSQCMLYTAEVSGVYAQAGGKSDLGTV